jgi:quinol monooxygenase YgiN
MSRVPALVKDSNRLQTPGIAPADRDKMAERGERPNVEPRWLSTAVTAVSAVVTLLLVLRQGARPQTAHPARVAIVTDASVPNAKILDFLELIERHAVATRAESGCARFDVVQHSGHGDATWWQSAGQSQTFTLYSVWNDVLALAAHEQTAHHQRLRAFVMSAGGAKMTQRRGGFPDQWAFG